MTFEAITAGFGERVASWVNPDPTLSTCSPTEAAIRNGIYFSNLSFTFPTTQKGGTMLGFIPKSILTFPAYLTNFKDTFTPNWTTQPIYGRVDDVPTYKNTTRKISLGFKIPCHSSSDSNENLKKINLLIKNLYPSYVSLKKTKANIVDSPPLIRIKFANLIVKHDNPAQGLLGYINSFSHDLGMNGSKAPFLESGIVTPGLIAPRVITFSLDMTVLHESIVGWQSGKAKFYGNIRDYPYRTKMSLGDAVALGADSIGLGSDVTGGEVLGW